MYNFIAKITYLFVCHAIYHYDSLGNLLYVILTGHWPFDDLENAQALVKQGRRPHINIDADYRHSKHPQIQTLLQAIDMCWKQDPHERATSRQVESVLAKYLDYQETEQEEEEEEKMEEKNDMMTVADKDEEEYEYEDDE